MLPSTCLSHRISLSSAWQPIFWAKLTRPRPSQLGPNSSWPYNLTICYDDQVWIRRTNIISISVLNCRRWNWWRISQTWRTWAVVRYWSPSPSAEQRPRGRRWAPPGWPLPQIATGHPLRRSTTQPRITTPREVIDNRNLSMSAHTLWWHYSILSKLIIVVENINNIKVVNKNKYFL